MHARAATLTIDEVEVRVLVDRSKALGQAPSECLLLFGDSLPIKQRVNNISIVVSYRHVQPSNRLLTSSFLEESCVTQLYAQR